ncbi:putative protein-tyrosine sulfotransferase [Panulirus ornatus]|uniref:putative protein-tyrosine sulfotransferase n=1 Tax=Panulirus ornatus TaxID=150431 RepID=UPI003A8A0DE6
MRQRQRVKSKKVEERTGHHERRGRRANHHDKRGKMTKTDRSTADCTGILLLAVKAAFLLALLGMIATSGPHVPQDDDDDHEVEPPPLPPLDYDEHLTFKEPVILVGGLPGAGTQLMRALLDAHPDIRCGEGQGVVHKMVRTWRSLAYNELEVERMKLGGVSEEMVDHAMILFLLEVLENNGPPAARLCTRDNLGLVGGRYLMHIFPNIKVVFMMRDTRAAAYSLVKRQTPVMGETMASVERGMYILENLVTAMRQECVMMGPRRCLPLQYESLVLKPRETMEMVMEFLGVGWSEEVLTHDHHHVNTTGDDFQPRTSAIYQDSLTTWVDHFPPYMRDYPDSYFRQLTYLGYDPGAFPPDYSRLRPFSWSRPEPLGLQEAGRRFLQLMSKIAARGAGVTVHTPSRRNLPIKEFLFL